MPWTLLGAFVSSELVAQILSQRVDEVHSESDDALPQSDLDLLKLGLQSWLGEASSSSTYADSAE